MVGGRRGEFASFELEWSASFNDRQKSYITWAVDKKRAWTMHPGALGPDPLTEIGQRIIPEEPMYMIFNFHMVSCFLFTLTSLYLFLLPYLTSASLTASSVKQLPSRQFQRIDLAK